MVADEARDALIQRRALRGAASNYAGKAVALGIRFLLTPFVLWALGETDYGLWVLVSAVAGYGLLLDFGIWGAITKYVAEHTARREHEAARSVVATALLLYTGLGLVVAAGGALLAPLIPNLLRLPPEQRTTATALTVLLALGVGVSLPCNTPLAVLRGLQRFDLTNAVRIGSGLATAAASVILLLAGSGVLGLAVLGVATPLVEGAAGLWLVRRVAPELRFGWRYARRRLVRKILTYSSSLFVLQVGGQLQSRVDELVVGAVLGVGVVAPYFLARRLGELVPILGDQVQKVLTPLASELDAEGDQRRLRAAYLTGTRLTLAAGLPIASALVVLGGPLLAAWVGPTFGDHGQLVGILAVAYLVDLGTWPAASVLRGMARHHPLAASSLATGLVNLALSLALAPRLGLLGVAIGTLLPTLAEAFGFVLPYTARLLRLSGRDVLAEIFLPALAPAVPALLVLVAARQWLSPSSFPSILLAAALGTAVYVAGYLRFGASAGERRLARGCVLGAFRLAGLRPRGTEAWRSG